MHHDTHCIGCISVSPPLSEEEVEVLLDLADSERTLRSTPTGRGNSEVPFARVAWDVCLDGCCLWWTGDEEDRWIGPTLEFLIDHWFRDGAVGQGHQKLEVFTFDHVLDGVLAVRGYRRCTIVEVSSNVVTWRHAAQPCDAHELRVPQPPPTRTPRPEEEHGAATKARPLPANVVELRPRRVTGGGGAAG